MSAEPSPRDSAPDGTRPAPRWRPWPLLLAALLVALLVWAIQARRPPPTADRAGPATGKTVKIVVEHADQKQKTFPEIPWHANMTVFEAMRAANADFSYQGSGAFALLTDLENVANEGNGAKAKNWIYRVNGKKANESFAVCRLQPSDVVLWRFETYD